MVESTEVRGAGSRPELVLFRPTLQVSMATGIGCPKCLELALLKGVS